ncbi:hypothetical protein ACFQLX_01700 [Streptomyces polyrhachis]|uniref:Type I-B CRISPR-associated protein Cas8b1/Cst1 n=1 Tax=Streptomyces polyrhachis TaxID=1282885 RepID=A0ABW2GBW9_9ACTN
MSTPETYLSEQSQLRLTSHPLQRVGAFALTALADADRGTGPEDLLPDAFEAAMAQVTRHAIQAALVRDSKGTQGFWLKASFSFFPNAPMNHPGNGKKSDDTVRNAVQAWHTLPDPASWPEGVSCVLCNRTAVGFYGKLDIALAESDAYRNTTPRGHAGMALCRPCRASFHALPYGCQLTGGSSIALHSWDDRFLSRAINRQAAYNCQIAMIGSPGLRQTEARETLALNALRRYGERLSAGVELMVFNNNNRGQSLEIHSLEQPLAEWLRHTSRDGGMRRKFTALLRAHAFHGTPGVVALGRNAFRSPQRIISTGRQRLIRLTSAAEPDREQIADLAAVLYSFVAKVMLMNEKDLSEIRETARRIATLLAVEETGGKLRQLRSYLNTSSRLLRIWLTGRAVQWAVESPPGVTGPMVSERAFALLFDPDSDNAAWYHRDLLLIGVLEELSRLGWTAKSAADENKNEIDEELSTLDKKYLEDTEEEQ